MGLDMYLERRPKNSSEELAYWRKTNWLHGYIVNTFANGVDECQEIPLCKDDVKQIYDNVCHCCSVLNRGTLLELTFDKTKNKYILKVDGRRVGIEHLEKTCDGLRELFDSDWRVDDRTARELGKLLPPCEGFFFGSYSYGLQYLMDMFETKNVLDKVLKEWDDDYNVYYQASWVICERK